jgi:hypothetical protein
VRTIGKVLIDAAIGALLNFQESTYAVGQVGAAAARVGAATHSPPRGRGVTAS